MTVRALPVSWDDEPVEWTPWETAPPVFICPPGKPSTCPRCRTVTSTQSQVSRGLIRGYLMLYAYRCPTCGHDTVVDHRTGIVWELDASDYGPQGSHEEDPVLW